MHKYFLVSLASVGLVFSGCFGPGPSNNNQSNNQNNQISTEMRIYNNNEFTINYPAAWDVIQPKDFTSEIPNETQVVFRNNFKNEDFTANINLIKHNLQTTKDSLDYGQEILNRQKTGLLNYRETKKEIVQRNVGGQMVETYLVEFEAKLNQTDPMLKFVQTFASKGNVAYTALGSYSPQENTLVINQLLESIKSLQVN